MLHGAASVLFSSAWCFSFEPASYAKIKTGQGAIWLTEDDFSEAKSKQGK